MCHKTKQVNALSLSLLETTVYMVSTKVSMRRMLIVIVRESDLNGVTLRSVSVSAHVPLIMFQLKRQL